MPVPVMLQMNTSDEKFVGEKAAQLPFAIANQEHLSANLPKRKDRIACVLQLRFVGNRIGSARNE